jgi:hypothetical protein
MRKEFQKRSRQVYNNFAVSLFGWRAPLLLVVVVEQSLRKSESMRNYNRIFTSGIFREHCSVPRHRTAESVFYGFSWGCFLHSILQSWSSELIEFKLRATMKRVWGMCVCAPFFRTLSFSWVQNEWQEFQFSGGSHFYIVCATSTASTKAAGEPCEGFTLSGLKSTCTTPNLSSAPVYTYKLSILDSTVYRICSDGCLTMDGTMLLSSYSLLNCL